MIITSPIRRNILSYGTSTFIKRGVIYTSSTFSSQLRFYTPGPPRNSYHATKNILQVLWHDKVPSTIKYFGIISVSAFALTHVHPNVLVTLGPPILVGGYFGYKRWMKSIYEKETKKITSVKDAESGSDQIRIRKYDESELYNVLNGLENQFDHFTKQILDIVERRIVDYVIEQKTRENESIDVSDRISRLFIDENNQISLHTPTSFETFVVSKVNEKEFLKMSVPFFSEKEGGKRLGSIEIYLVGSGETLESQAYDEYKIGIEISEYGFERSSIYFTSVGEGITKSKILVDYEKENGKKEENEEEITVDL